MKTSKELESVEAELSAVIQRITLIEPQVNEILDRYQRTTRAEGREMKKKTPEWALVEEMQELVSRRAKLRDARDVEMALCGNYSWRDE